jgi:hypothetical protein
LVAADPASAEIIKPYLRGQDLERWIAPDIGFHMIFARRGIEIDRYPAVLGHLSRFRQAAAEAQRLERRLSDLVNQAYGLTPDEVALMWATAPPRMPLTP